MQATPKRKYTKKEIKLSHVKKWRQSGLSMIAYASEAGISASNLSKWVQSENKNKATFKPIAVTPAAPVNQNNVIEIIVDQRIKIRLSHHNADPLVVLSIVRSLMQCN